MGAWAAEILAEQGGKVLAVSDVGRCVVCGERQMVIARKAEPHGHQQGVAGVALPIP